MWRITTEVQSSPIDFISFLGLRARCASVIALIFFAVVTPSGCHLSQERVVWSSSGGQTVSVDSEQVNFAHNLILIRASVNGSDPCDFMLDTGTTLTCVDKDVAARLKMQSSFFSVLAQDAFDKAIVVPTCTFPCLKIAGVEIRDVKAAIVDLGPLQELLSLRVSGILGGNVLRNFEMLIDYEGSRLVLRRPAPMKYGPFTRVTDTFVLDFDLVHRGPQIEVVLNGVYRRRLTVDTGCAGGIYLSGAPDDFGIVNESKILRGLSVAGLLGVGIETSLARIGRVRIGDYVAESAIASFVDHVVDEGSIGNGFLARRFDRITINYRTQQILLECDPKWKCYDAIIGTGISVEEKSDATIVSHVQQDSPAQNIGIHVGDRLVRIDEHDIAELSLGEIRRLLNVTLTVRIQKGIVEDTDHERIVGRILEDIGPKVKVTIERDGKELGFAFDRVERL